MELWISKPLLSRSAAAAEKKLTDWSKYDFSFIFPVKQSSLDFFFFLNTNNASQQKLLGFVENVS